MRRDSMTIQDSSAVTNTTASPTNDSYYDRSSPPSTGHLHYESAKSLHHHLHNNSTQHHNHNHHHHGIGGHHVELFNHKRASSVSSSDQSEQDSSSDGSISGSTNGTSSRTDASTDEDSELEYGPGIVAKLTSKFLRFSMKSDVASGHGIKKRNNFNNHHKLKRCSSLENILEPAPSPKVPTRRHLPHKKQQLLLQQQHDQGPVAAGSGSEEAAVAATKVQLSEISSGPPAAASAAGTAGILTPETAPSHCIEEAGSASDQEILLTPPKVPARHHLLHKKQQQQLLLQQQLQQSHDQGPVAGGSGSGEAAVAATKVQLSEISSGPPVVASAGTAGILTPAAVAAAVTCVDDQRRDEERNHMTRPVTQKHSSVLPKRSLTRGSTLPPVKPVIAQKPKALKANPLDHLKAASPPASSPSPPVLSSPLLFITSSPSLIPPAGNHVSEGEPAVIERQSFSENKVITASPAKAYDPGTTAGAESSSFPLILPAETTSTAAAESAATAVTYFLSGNSLITSQPSLTCEAAAKGAPAQQSSACVTTSAAILSTQILNPFSTSAHSPARLAVSSSKTTAGDSHTPSATAAVAETSSRLLSDTPADLSVTSSSSNSRTIDRLGTLSSPAATGNPDPESEAVDMRNEKENELPAPDIVRKFRKMFESTSLATAASAITSLTPAPSASTAVVDTKPIVISRHEKVTSNDHQPASSSCSSSIAIQTHHHNNNNNNKHPAAATPAKKTIRSEKRDNDVTATSSTGSLNHHNSALVSNSPGISEMRDSSTCDKKQRMTRSGDQLHHSSVNLNPLSSSSASPVSSPASLQMLASDAKNDPSVLTSNSGESWTSINETAPAEMQQQPAADHKEIPVVDRLRQQQQHPDECLRHAMRESLSSLCQEQNCEKVSQGSLSLTGSASATTTGTAIMNPGTIAASATPNECMITTMAQVVSHCDTDHAASNNNNGNSKNTNCKEQKSSAKQPAHDPTEADGDDDDNSPPNHIVLVANDSGDKKTAATGGGTRSDFRMDGGTVKSAETTSPPATTADISQRGKLPPASPANTFHETYHNNSIHNHPDSQPDECNNSTRAPFDPVVNLSRTSVNPVPAARPVPPPRSVPDMKTILSPARDQMKAPAVVTVPPMPIVTAPAPVPRKSVSGTSPASHSPPNTTARNNKNSSSINNNNSLNERSQSPTMKALLDLHEQKPNLIISSSVNQKSNSNSMIFDFRGKNVKPQLAITSPFGRSAVIGSDESEVDGDKGAFDPNSSDSSTSSDLSPTLVFLGENEIIGNGSLLKIRNKKLRIHFNESSLSSTYEYPSEAFLFHHFDDEDEDGISEGDPNRNAHQIAGDGNESNVNCDKSIGSTDCGRDPLTSSVTGCNSSNLQSSLTLRSSPSGGLASYQPTFLSQAEVLPFELGVVSRTSKLLQNSTGNNNKSNTFSSASSRGSLDSSATGSRGDENQAKRANRDPSLPSPSLRQMNQQQLKNQLNNCKNEDHMRNNSMQHLRSSPGLLTAAAAANHHSHHQRSHLQEKDDVDEELLADALIKPANSDETSSWSTSSTASDLLF